MIKSVFLTLLLISLSTVYLTGCMPVKDAQSISSHLNGHRALSKISLSKFTSLNLDGPWPLTQKGTYTQQIKTTFNGGQKKVLIQLTLEVNKFHVVAVDDLVGFIYQVTWTPGQISWIASKYVPPTFNPEYIVADFLLTQLDYETLKTLLKGATVQDTGSKRLIESNSSILREIHRDTLSNGLWTHVLIKNVPLGYRLDINTVADQ